MSRRAICVCVVLLSVLPVLNAAAPPAEIDSTQVKKLFRQLDHDEFAVRQQADETLRAMGKLVVSALKQEMERSRSLEVRWRLGRMINDLTLDERVEVLVKLLGDGDSQMRDRAEWTLRQGGSAVVPMLQKELKPRLTQQHRQRLQKIISELTTAASGR
jgi:HEAT repeat protein